MRRPVRARAMLSFFRRNQEELDNQLPATTISWLEARGLPPQDVTARDVGAEGRGLVATRRIGAGNSILLIPRELILTTEDAVLQSVLSASAQRAGLPDWSVLAMFLVEAKLQGGTEWGEYVAMLPSTTGCVLEWKQSQVDKLLIGSQLYEGAKQIRAAADASWLGLQPLLAEAATKDALGGRSPTRQDCQWAFSMLLSRLIRLPGLQWGVEALVPWADLLNHSCDCDSTLDWNETSVTFRPDTGYSRGQQLFCSYGPKSSADLLLSYGFVQAGLNPNESVPLRIGVTAGDPLHDAKVTVLSALSFQPSRDFPLRLNAFPEGLIPFAALVSATTSEQLDTAAAALANGSEADLSGETLCSAFRTIRTRCRGTSEALSRASTKFKDTPLAGTMQQGDVRLEQLIAEVYAREMRVLNRAVFLLTQMIRDCEKRGVDATILAGFTP